MNYSNNIDQIVFLKDRDIVLSIDGTNLSGAVLSNGIPSYDLLSAQVNILSSRDDFLSNYISDFIEVSCNNLCTVVSNLINRDHKDVSYLGNVKLSTEYLDAIGTGLAENTLYGLLLTNKNSDTRKMHSGFLFNAIADDPLSDFTIVDGNGNTAILHDNDYILVVNDVESVVDIQLSDVRFIKDYTKIANTLSVYEQNLCTDIQILSTQLSTDLSCLSRDLMCLSSNLCTEISNLSSELCIEIKTLSTGLSTDVNSLSDDMIKRDKAISDYISSYVEVSCSNLCVVVSSLINRDYKDVSFFGDVNLADSYSDPEHEGIIDNTLFGLLLTNGKTRERKLHPGYLFHAKAEDTIKNFEVKDGNGDKLILHDNDYILVANDVNAVKNVNLSDVILIKDYTSDLSTMTTNLSIDINSISTEIYSNISAISVELSNYTKKESAKLCSEISSLSSNLSTDIKTLSIQLSTDVSSLLTNLCTEIQTLSIDLSTDLSVLSIDLSVLSIDLSGLSSDICSDIKFINKEINNIKNDVRGGVNYKGHISLSAGRYYTATGTLDLSGVFGAYLNAVTTEGTLSNDIELNNGWLYNVTTINPYTTNDGITFENNDYIIIHNHDLSSAHISELTRSTIDIIEAVQDDYVRLYQLQKLSDDLSVDVQSLSTNLSTDIKTITKQLSDEISTLSTNLSTDIDLLSTHLSTSVNDEFVHMSGDVGIGTLQINGNVSADEFTTNKKLAHSSTYGISSITYNDYSLTDTAGPIKTYDIAYPEKSGTIALTSDVVSLSNNLTTDIETISTTLSLDISSTVAIYNSDGEIIGNKLSVLKISNHDYDEAAKSRILNDQCIYIINDSYASMRGQLICNVADPIVSSDAATKNYVDGIANQTSSNIENLSIALSNEIKSLSDNLSVDISYLSTSLSLDVKQLSTDLSDEIVILSTHLSTSVNDEFVHMSGDVGIGTLQINGNVSADEFTINQNLAHTAIYGVSSITYIDNLAVYGGGDSKKYDIAYPEKSGTIALTSDVVGLSNNLSAEINSVSTLLSNDLSSTIAIYSDNGIQYVGNKLSVVKISNEEYATAVQNHIIDDKIIYIINDTFDSAFGQQIKNIADPTISSDAATKNYVDGISATISSNVDIKFATKTELNELTLSVDRLSAAVNYVSSDLSTLEYKHYYATLSSIENKTDVHIVEGQYPDNLMIVDHTNEHEGHQKYYLKFEYGTLVLVECD